MGARFERYKIRHCAKEEMSLPTITEIQSIIGKIIKDKYKEFGDTESEMMALANSIYLEHFAMKKKVEEFGEFIGHLTLIFAIMLAKWRENPKSS